MPQILYIEYNGICFNVFCYNVQPGVEIEYATGDSYLSEVPDKSLMTPLELQQERQTDNEVEAHYIGNKNTKKFHIPTCSSVSYMKESNKISLYETREHALAQGFSPCRRWFALT